ncbi:MAG: hypothetical protein ABI360_01285 [Allobranchiibius sp.]
MPSGLHVQAESLTEAAKDADRHGVTGVALFVVEQAVANSWPLRKIKPSAG